MARVKFISSRPNKPSKPITTKSRPGDESVCDSHTGSYVEASVKPVNEITVILPDYCHVKQPELLQSQKFPYGLPTPPPENQSFNPRKRRYSSNHDTDLFCLPPPALDIKVSIIYDSPRVTRLRRACRQTPPSSPESVLERKIDNSKSDIIRSELSSASETSVLPASEEHVGAADKYRGTTWNKEAAMRAKEFWSKTYEPSNRGRQAHRLKFNYTSVMEQDSEYSKARPKILDRSSVISISPDSSSNGDIKRRKISSDRITGEEQRAKAVRPGENYWPAWRKYREMEDSEHWEIFMGWKE